MKRKIYQQLLDWKEKRNGEVALLIEVVCFEGLCAETSRNFSEIKIFRKLTSDCNRLIVSTNTYYIFGLYLTEKSL